jgi:hypothetical protein
MLPRCSCWYPSFYEDLRRLARLQLGHEYGERTLNATALVRESYLKLGAGALAATDRAHFLAISARATRQVLVDHARDRKAAKTGGGSWERITLTDGVWVGEFDPDGVLQLAEAVAAMEPRQRASRRVPILRWHGRARDRRGLRRL